MMNNIYKMIVLIIIISVNNCSFADMLSCRFEGMSHNDGPIRQHPTGEKVTVSVTSTRATLWANQEYSRVTKLDEILPSGKKVHTYARKSEFGKQDKDIDYVRFMYEEDRTTVFFQTINVITSGGEMSVYGRCFRK